jgi:hypothetical protein
MNSAHALFFFNFNSLEKGRRIISDSNQEKRKKKEKKFWCRKNSGKNFDYFSGLDRNERNFALQRIEKKTFEIMI